MSGRLGIEWKNPVCNREAIWNKCKETIQAMQQNIHPSKQKFERFKSEQELAEVDQGAFI